MRVSGSARRAAACRRCKSKSQKRIDTAEGTEYESEEASMPRRRTLHGGRRSFTGPARPGTRAALYRLLAQQPGIRLVDSVTDPLGRAGVGVTDGGGDFLVIDPRTAMELASSSALVQARATMAMTRGVSVMEAMGWTNQLGAVPQP